MRKLILINRRFVFLIKYIKYNFNYFFIIFKKGINLFILNVFIMCVLNVLRVIVGIYFVCSLLVFFIFRYYDGGVYVIDVL